MASMPGLTSADAPAPQGTHAASADVSQGQPTPPPKVDPVHVQPEIPTNTQVPTCPKCGEGETQLLWVCLRGWMAVTFQPFHLSCMELERMESRASR